MMKKTEKVRSWDSIQSVMADASCHPTYAGLRVRIVEWLPEWPPQEKVPQAGTRWNAYGETVEIATGIPYITGGACLLQCLRPDGRSPEMYNLEKLKPIPPEPETASGEVVDTVTIKHWPDGSFSFTSDSAPKDGVYKLIKVSQ